jgi:Helix-turn-helix domain
MPTTWTALVWRHFHAHNLTPADRDILLTLATFRGRGGACFPSHATLAQRTRRKRSSVKRALNQGQHLGLIDWKERPRRRVGWRSLRTSNSYRLLVPTHPVKPGQRLPWWRKPAVPAGPCTRVQIERAEGRENLSAMIRAAVGAGDLLRKRREAVEAMLKGRVVARMA